MNTILVLLQSWSVCRTLLSDPPEWPHKYNKHSLSTCGPKLKTDPRFISYTTTKKHIILEQYTFVVFRFVSATEQLLLNITTFSLEDGGSTFLRNVGIYLQVHTALVSRRPTSTSSRPWNLRSYHYHYFSFATLNDVTGWVVETWHGVLR
jgi:hypothetical protein